MCLQWLSYLHTSTNSTITTTTTTTTVISSNTSTVTNTITTILNIIIRRQAPKGVYGNPLVDFNDICTLIEDSPKNLVNFGVKLKSTTNRPNFQVPFFL